MQGRRKGKKRGERKVAREETIENNGRELKVSGQCVTAGTVEGEEAGMDDTDRRKYKERDILEHGEKQGVGGQGAGGEGAGRIE